MRLSRNGAATADQEDAVTVERDVSPATEAGRALLDFIDETWRLSHAPEPPVDERILAIEQEAAALERRNVIAQVWSGVMESIVGHAVASEGHEVEIIMSLLDDLGDSR